MSQDKQIDPKQFQLKPGSINMPGQTSIQNNTNDTTVRDLFIGAAAGSGITLLGFYLANKNSEQRRKNKTHTKQKPSSFAI